LINSNKLKIYIAPLITLTFLLGLYGCPAQQTTQQVVIQNVIKDSNDKNTTNPSGETSKPEQTPVATPTPEEAINITGTWLGSYTGITEFYMTATCTIALVITQSGSNLSGTASNTCSMTGVPSPITGTFKGKDVHIVDTVSGVEFNGLLTDSKQMQGSITGVMGTTIFYKN